MALLAIVLLAADSAKQKQAEISKRSLNADLGGVLLGAGFFRLALESLADSRSPNLVGRLGAVGGQVRQAVIRNGGGLVRRKAAKNIARQLGMGHQIARSQPGLRRKSGALCKMRSMPGCQRP
jgi:hypothetical protein